MMDDEKSKAIARYTKIAGEHIDKVARNAFNSPEEAKKSNDKVKMEKTALMAMLTDINQDHV